MIMYDLYFDNHFDVSKYVSLVEAVVRTFKFDTSVDRRIMVFDDIHCLLLRKLNSDIDSSVRLVYSCVLRLNLTKDYPFSFEVDILPESCIWETLFVLSLAQELYKTMIRERLDLDSFILSLNHMMDKTLTRNDYWFVKESLKLEKVEWG